MQCNSKKYVVLFWTNNHLERSVGGTFLQKQYLTKNGKQKLSKNVDSFNEETLVYKASSTF